ncbi:T-cell receptor alpha chain V region CTL-L17 [Microtus ochrogaster]|nr:T-cell receptor alpha chain V region CTL-L17 [Microtus ochrogaster]
MKTLIGPFVLCLWLQLNCVSRGEQLEQTSLLSVQEGGSAVINCTYTDSTNYYFYWYKQEPGAGIKFLMNVLSNVDRKEDQGLIVLLNKEDKRLSLNITAAHPGDSATYFCAASAHSTENKRTEQQGFHTTLHKSSSSFHLQKSSVQLWDCALYYCADASGLDRTNRNRLSWNASCQENHQDTAKIIGYTLDPSTPKASRKQS